jgi:hypothetical protein
LPSLLACNGDNPKTEDTKTETAEVKANVPSNTYGFTPAYSASFVMDSAKNTETVLALWTEWKSGDLSNSSKIKILFIKESVVDRNRFFLCVSELKKWNTPTTFLAKSLINSLSLLSG